MATWNVVGEIASVGGVTSIVQLSLQVILAVTSYASSVAGAEAARMSLRNELLSLNKTLNHIYFLLQQSNAALSTRANDSSPLHSALKECEKVLQDLHERIPENKRQTWFGSRLAWPFQQADIMNAVDTLERCKSTLSLTISSGLLSQVTELAATTKEIQVNVKDEAENIKQEISKRTSEVKRKIEDVREEITAAKLEITVHTFDNSIAHIAVTQETIAKWREQERLEILADQERKDLLQWLGGFDCTVKHEEVSAQRRDPRTLTRLYNSAIINELLAHGETPVYFYCDFRQERTTDGATVLRSLLIQLLRQARDEWNSEFTVLFRRKSEGAEPPADTDVLCDLVCRSLKFLRQPVAIIDALDECELVGTFLKRLLCAANEGDMRLLITTTMINNDMELHIDKELNARQRLGSLTPDLKDESRKSLLQQAAGCLYETYDRILQEIEEAGPDRRSIVERTLMWLVAALEPLSLSQLVEALSIDIRSTTLNQKLSVMSPRDLLETCSCLVKTPRSTAILLEDAHRHIVQCCTQYLISDDVLNSTHTRPMLRYALYFGLGAHITSIMREDDSVLSCLEDLPERICIWLADPQSICDTLIRFGPDWMVHRHLREHREHWNHVLQYAILEGKTPLANVVLSLGRNVNLPITIGLETTSPVKFALRHSSQKLIECFLSRGARLPVDAIHTVLEERQVVDSDILSLLIHHGANVHATHVHFQDNPLHTLFRKDAQSQESCLEAARVLVGAGCEFNSRNPAGWTPLDFAMMKSFNHAGDYLLHMGATASGDVIRSSDAICWHLCFNLIDNTKRVRINQVYQEFIQDKNHLHMNATRWVTLTEFAKYLGRSGIARVDETEKGWFIAWIDSSPKALAKQEASIKKDRATRDDEQREGTLISEQIERAKLEKEASDEGSASPMQRRFSLKYHCMSDMTRKEPKMYS
ncbi:hypothetical protein EV702DRAFT_1194187 [Suillus placidus]|uniref:DNA/RNA-binding protein Kin17 WH-like domain-containing protein n=1 Tax=Suillus placidus TaxID=48579 RepID=A0A9P7A3G1_9AGAM|nr:hypothetical protein EV702DRAFT_1194187 [Suillus placidus]